MCVGSLHLRRGIEARHITIPFGEYGTILSTFAYIQEHKGDDARFFNSQYRINSGVPLEGYVASKSHIWLEIPVLDPNDTVILYTAQYIQEGSGHPSAFDEPFRIHSELGDIEYTLFKFYTQEQISGKRGF